MKKIVLLFVLTCAICFPSFAFSAEGDKTVTEDIISIGKGGKLYIEHTKIEGMMGSFDKIIRDRLSRPIIIYDSEGRHIEKVYEYDFNKDGDPELLIQMDLGGSSGYKEFVLLLHDTSSYKQIWEATGYPGATVVIKNYMDKTRVYIRYLDENTVPAKTKVDVFEFLDEGRMIEMTAGTAG